MRINLPIALTMGDPAGVGPEIIVNAFNQAPEIMSSCFVVGDTSTIRRAVEIVKSLYCVAELDSLTDLHLIPPKCLAVWPISGEKNLSPFGQLSSQAGRMAAESVQLATQAALRGDVAAIVTAPLHKEALSMAGSPHDHYPGHTEMLQAISAAHLGLAVEQLPVRMMLANGELRVVLVSIHMSMVDAVNSVTHERVLETLKITHASLLKTLGRAPRIGVAGLNPHAGEGGLFGREEIESIAPAVYRAQELGINVAGPFAPDTIFMRARNQGGKLGEFDVVVAMYHDQGLIPVKYLGVDHGVNITLGLPFIRTSPDHGTAFDIAGKNLASASSFLAAVAMAKSLSKQAEYSG